jgi:hypothetical protein
VCNKSGLKESICACFSRHQNRSINLLLTVILFDFEVIPDSLPTWLSQYKARCDSVNINNPLADLMD